MAAIVENDVLRHALKLIGRPIPHEGNLKPCAIPTHDRPIEPGSDEAKADEPNPNHVRLRSRTTLSEATVFFYITGGHGDQCRRFEVPTAVAASSSRNFK